nr:MAG TPA: hypothetical protein [Caudoviricetes sp.]
MQHEMQHNFLKPSKIKGFTVYLTGSSPVIRRL